MNEATRHASNIVSCAVHFFGWSAAAGALLLGDATARLALAGLLVVAIGSLSYVAGAAAFGAAPPLPEFRAAVWKRTSALGLLCAAAAAGMFWLALGALVAYAAQSIARRIYWGDKL